MKLYAFHKFTTHFKCGVKMFAGCGLIAIGLIVGTRTSAGGVATIDNKAGVLTNSTADGSTNAPKKRLSGNGKRYDYTPKPYPVDDRGFSPVDKALANAYAREDMVQDDAEESLNPYVLKVISGYPLDGSYTYHGGREEPEEPRPRLLELGIQRHLPELRLPDVAELAQSPPSIVLWSCFP